MSRNDDKYLEKLRFRYRKAKKKQRTSILDEFVKTTGYHRKYATVLLNGNRERVQGAIRRPRRRVYGAEEADAVMLCRHSLTTSAPNSFGRRWTQNCHDCTRLVSSKAAPSVMTDC